MSREPVVFITAIMAIVYVLVTFGLPLTDTQEQAIEAALVAIGAVWARSRVTPVP